VLLIVRHGETIANRRGLLLGRSDPSLTALGTVQARQLALSLPEPDRVVSSPLARACETAAMFGRPVEVDERWIELDYGELDGRPPGSVPDDVWVRWRTDPSFTPSGSEPLRALAGRVSGACADLSAAAVDSTIVVVTHVSPIKAALAWALDAPVEISWHMYVEDASVSRIDIESGRPVVRWFNRGITGAG
jgi:broad specificity phosphatase PhoE